MVVAQILPLHWPEPALEDRDGDGERLEKREPERERGEIGCGDEKCRR